MTRAETGSVLQRLVRCRCAPPKGDAMRESTTARAAARYLTNDEAAEFLRLSPRTLEKQRVIGGGPRFHKFGPTATRATTYTARLTIDVTPALRGRIKVAAFRQDVTVADLLRALLEREFPDQDDIV